MKISWAILREPRHLVLLSIVMLAAYLRLRHLGDLPLHGDEDLTALAVKGILASGLPSLPSGMLYLRGMLYSYLAAASSLFLGLNELALRVPSAVCGIILVCVVFDAARRIFDRETALISALLVTLSSSLIFYFRTARMYGLLCLLFLLAFILVCRALTTGRLFHWFLALVTFVLGSLSHGLAVMFSVLLPSAMFVKKKITWPLLIGLVVSLVGFTVVRNEVLYKPYETFKMQQPSANSSSVRPEVTASFDLAQTLSGLVPLVPVTYRSIERALSQPYWIIVVALLIVGSALVVRSGHMILFLPLGLAGFNQAGLSAIAIYLLWYFQFCETGGRIHVGKWLSLVMGLLFTVYLAINMDFYTNEGYGGGVALRKALKDGLYLSSFNLRVYGKFFPVETLFVTGLVGYYLKRALDGKVEREVLFLIFTFLLISLVVPMLKEYVKFRYVIYLYPLWIMLFANALTLVARRIAKQESGPRLAMVMLGVLVIATQIVGDFQIADALNVSGGKHKVGYSVGFQDPFIPPDPRSAAEFVQGSRHQGDVVVAVDNTAQFYYLGGVDYTYQDHLFVETFTYRRANNSYDIYTGVQVIDSLEKLQGLVFENGGVWVITKPLWDRSNQERDDYIALERYLEESHENLKYVARDGETKVYYLTNRRL